MVCVCGGNPLSKVDPNGLSDFSPIQRFQTPLEYLNAKYLNVDGVNYSIGGFYGNDAGDFGLALGIHSSNNTDDYFSNTDQYLSSGGVISGLNFKEDTSWSFMSDSYNPAPDLSAGSRTAGGLPKGVHAKTAEGPWYGPNILEMLEYNVLSQTSNGAQYSYSGSMIGGSIPGISGILEQNYYHAGLTPPILGYDWYDKMTISLAAQRSGLANIDFFKTDGIFSLYGALSETAGIMTGSYGGEPTFSAGAGVSGQIGTRVGGTNDFKPFLGVNLSGFAPLEVGNLPQGSTASSPLGFGPSLTAGAAVDFNLGADYFNLNFTIGLTYSSFGFDPDYSSI